MRKPEGRHRDSNPEPSNHVSSALTTALSRHDRFRRLDSDPKYSVTFAARSVVSPTALAINSRPTQERAYMAPGAGICTSEMGAAIGSRTAPKGCAVLAQPYVLQKQWWGPPQGLEQLPRAGLRQNRHYVYYCCGFILTGNCGVVQMRYPRHTVSVGPTYQSKLEIFILNFRMPSAKP